MEKEERFIGFFGCSVAEKLVSVRPPRGTDHKPHAMKTWEVNPCPACGNPHRVRPMWRAAKSEAEWARAEVFLSTDSEIDPEQRGRDRAKKSKGVSKNWSWSAVGTAPSKTP